MSQNEELRYRSGSVNSTEPLVSFLYILMRDHLPAGVVERIYQEHVAGTFSNSKFTNGYLASYAKDLAERIRATPE